MYVHVKSVHIHDDLKIRCDDFICNIVYSKISKPSFRKFVEGGKVEFERLWGATYRNTCILWCAYWQNNFQGGKDSSKGKCHTNPPPPSPK